MFRQIASSEVANATEVTRSSIQKSVCIISKWPLYGMIANKLELITHAYFEERDFSKARKTRYRHQFDLNTRGQSLGRRTQTDVQQSV
jgi:hypothetical protein